MEADRLVDVAEIGGARIARGVVAHSDVDGTVLVALGDTGEEVRCHLLRTGPLDGGVVVVARDAVLVWQTGRPDDWGVVLGRIGPSHAPPEPETDEPPSELVIEAARNLTLKCGDGSITIRDDGRILIKGKDLVSHARRMNRIRGGAVAIN